MLALFSMLLIARFDAVRAPQVLDERLRQLENDIAAVRGLAFKTPVRAHVIARPANTEKSLQGYYSVKDKALFFYDDLSGAYEKGVLIHEMVHALQDQHFDLGKLKAKLHADSYGSDAELALAALIEGDATYTMIEVLKKEQPKVAGMLDLPLTKAKNLERAFLYAEGARYVKALKERGGWEAVNNAYKFPPRNTASILEGKNVASINLGPGRTLGAWRIVRLLASQPATRDRAVDSAKGWRGDREVTIAQAKAWQVAFASAEQARAFQTTMSTVLSPKKAPAKATVLCRGRRVIVIEAPDDKTYTDLLDRVDGPQRLEVYAVHERKMISFGDMIERLLDADIVCVGENHDSDLHHRVQLAVIKGLFARDERLGVGMEMFQRPFQKHLDAYVSGTLNEEQFLKSSEYAQRWGYDWSLYEPIASFCQRNGVPLAALNAPKELTSRVSKVGHDGLSDEEKEQLGPIDFHLKEHRDYWYERLAKMHGEKNATAERKERSYQVMTVWDDYMAQSAAKFQQDRALRRLVVLAGSGHIERGFGIPQRTVRHTGGRALTVAIQVSPETPTLPTEALTDFLVVVR